MRLLATIVFNVVNGTSKNAMLPKIFTILIMLYYVLSIEYRQL